jgi:hypothetical protein
MNDPDILRGAFNGNPDALRSLADDVSRQLQPLVLAGHVPATLGSTIW